MKISNVLDKVALTKLTLIDDPPPVAGMPELHGSLARPQFIYVLGSPFQLYPFLRSFINTTYSASNGPIFLQNLTLVDIPEVVDFVTNGNVFEYKAAMIDRIKGMYPNKRFLCGGGRDPETYGKVASYPMCRQPGTQITHSLEKGSENTVMPSLVVGSAALNTPTTQTNALLRPLLAFRRINSEFLTTRKFPPLPKSISLGELNAFDLISEQHVLPLGT